jgi:hypothetical protein
MDEYFQLQLETRRIKARSKVNSGRFGTVRPGFSPDETGFKCSHCRSFVSAEPVLSGVNISTCTRQATGWLPVKP